MKNKDQKPSGSSATAQGTTTSPASSASKEGGGQKVSKERGAHTRSKKNPGKRPHQGGGST